MVDFRCTARDSLLRIRFARKLLQPRKSHLSVFTLKVRPGVFMLILAVAVYSNYPADLMPPGAERFFGPSPLSPRCQQHWYAQKAATRGTAPRPKPYANASLPRSSAWRILLFTTKSGSFTISEQFWGHVCSKKIEPGCAKPEVGAQSFQTLTPKARMDAADRHCGLRLVWKKMKNIDPPGSACRPSAFSGLPRRAWLVAHFSL